MSSEALLFAEYLEHRNCKDGVLRRLWFSQLRCAEAVQVSEWAEADKAALYARAREVLDVATKPLLDAMARTQQAILEFQRLVSYLPKSRVYRHKQERAKP